MYIVGFSREQRYFDYRFCFSTGINTLHCRLVYTHGLFRQCWLVMEKYTMVQKKNVFFACVFLLLFSSFIITYLCSIGTRFGFRIVTLCIKITLCTNILYHTVYLRGIILKPLYIKHFCSLLLVCKIDS